MSGPKHPAMAKLLFFIIDWNKSKIVSKVFEQENVPFYFFSPGKGTANSEVLDVLGIGSSAKAVILCIERDLMAPLLVKGVRQKLGSLSAGAGIAFTVPLSAINQPILQILKESVHPNLKDQENEQRKPKKMSEITNDLIISIINQGYSDEFMTAAKEAGARGGTVIAARGLTSSKPVKFFGVSIQDEKEIILILSSRDKKTAIMEAISKAYGVNSQADGIIFSLPVDEVMSLNTGSI
ncbi:MAG: P-II family nitrogen regulator [Spirochaetaceae bacterium]|jgi:nitrogen regulatory protein PII|nr:P-II family nitrogen regulator [Spirochaetaceae bacterium]